MSPEQIHFGVNWRFVNTGLCSGAFNMEYDEHLAKELLEGTGVPTVRVYGWEPHAISLGYHQKDNEIDLERCLADGVDIVRRPTGGRAIFHAHELTYSVVMCAEGRSVTGVYEYISRALVAGLRCLGVHADLAERTLESGSPSNGHRTVACFASTSKFEVQYRRKKIAGSAQRRYMSSRSIYDPVVLQHGSVLLGLQHRKLVEYVTCSSEREIMRGALFQGTTDAESILGRPVSFEEAAVAMRKGFEETWGVRFLEGEGKQISVTQHE